MRLADRIAEQEAEKTAAQKTAAKKSSAKKSAERPGRSGGAEEPLPAGTTVDPERRSARRKSRDSTDLLEQVRRSVLADLAPRLAEPGGHDDTDLEEEIRTIVESALAELGTRLPKKEREAFVRELVSDMLGYGPLDGPLMDPTVTEVMCNRHDDIWVERQGRLSRTDLEFRDEIQYRHVIERIVARVGRRVDEGSPMVDARLPSGYRVNVIIPPLALDGPVLTIRKFADNPFSVHDLVSFGSLSTDLAAVLEACVRGRLNILVSGGTATGKSTLLNVLSGFIPEGERIITIEDAAELQVQQRHVIGLEARPANAEGRGQVTIRDLVRNALRMRPDRIVVGEVRGGEALDMLQAMNTGHEGSITTIHANSARDALSRLEVLVLMAGYELPVRAIREQIAAGIDLIVHLDRLRDGDRVVTSVQEVQGLEGDVIVLQEVFTHSGVVTDAGRQVGEITPTGLRPRFLERLAAEGVELSPSLFGRRRAAPARKGR